MCFNAKLQNDRAEHWQFLQIFVMKISLVFPSFARKNCVFSCVFAIFLSLDREKRVYARNIERVIGNNSTSRSRRCLARSHSSFQVSHFSFSYFLTRNHKVIYT